jgi:hypothetical protein
MDHHELFEISFRGGGGPLPFHQALARKFHELVERGTYCVILSPVERPTRYVQALVSSAGARVESVGSLYLANDDALSASQELALETLEWLAPPEPDDDPDWQWPYNWWRELSGPGFLENAAALLLTTLVEVHELANNEPVRLEVLPASNPRYRWEVDPEHPCGGQLVAA